MYRSFFEMERMPFVRDVPIQELYESPAMSEEGRIYSQTEHWTIFIKNLPGSRGVSTASAKRA